MPEQITREDSEVNGYKIRQITDPKDPILNIISNWICDWWEESEAYEKERMLEYYKHSVLYEKLPQTYVAYKGEQAVGTFQFGISDIFIRPDLYPWLKNVYVVPEHRCNGCATAMLEYAVAKMCTSQYECFYLFTHLEGFYERFGWKFIERFNSYELDMGFQRMYIFKNE